MQFFRFLSGPLKGQERLVYKVIDWKPDLYLIHFTQQEHDLLEDFDLIHKGREGHGREYKVLYLHPSLPEDYYEIQGEKHGYYRWFDINSGVGAIIHIESTAMSNERMLSHLRRTEDIY